MSTQQYEAQPTPSDTPLEDPPAISAKSIVVGHALLDILHQQTPAVQSELLEPLVNTLTSTEILGSRTAAEALSMAEMLEENAATLREYARTQAIIEQMPIEPRVEDLDY